MYRLVRENVPGALLFRATVELGWLFGAVILAGKLGNSQWNPSQQTIANVFLFATMMVGINLTFGFYRRACRLSLRDYVIREIVVLCVEFPIAYMLSKVLFGSAFLHEGHAYAVLYALAGLVVVRQIFAWPFVRTIVPRRVLVLGTGSEARALEESLKEVNLPRLEVVGFCCLDPHDVTVAANRIVPAFAALETTVERLDIDEVVVAVREQRGGVLPLKALLDCRLRGVQVTALPRFFERVHRRVPLSSLKASWLIYGRGFSDHPVRRGVKRAFDVALATTLLVVVLPVMAVTALAILLTARGPVFSRQDRVGYRGKTFAQFIFRIESDRAGGRSKDRNASSVTNLGRLLHGARFDELPQLINVLKGDMSMVGPRAERREAVAALTETIPFYSLRHSVVPGITGWAQVQSRRLDNGRCGAPAQVVKKLEYDLYYAKNHTIVLDVIILLKAIGIVVFGAGGR